jgi:DNA replication protein DnaC
LQAYLRPAVLIVDDFGSQALDRSDALMVLQVLSGRHAWGSTIVTSASCFTDWRHSLGGPVLATAILDQLLNHCDVINMSAHVFERTVGRRRQEGHPGEGSAFPTVVGNGLARMNRQVAAQRKVPRQ